MRSLLHILTEPNDAFATEIIARQKADAENKIEIVDLSRADTDYKALVEKIFTADSVQVW
jgi:hypothetical protein